MTLTIHLVALRKRSVFKDYDKLTNPLLGLIEYFSIQNEYFLLLEQVGEEKALEQTCFSKMHVLKCTDDYLKLDSELLRQEHRPKLDQVFRFYIFHKTFWLGDLSYELGVRISSKFEQPLVQDRIFAIL